MLKSQLFVKNDQDLVKHAKSRGTSIPHPLRTPMNALHARFDKKCTSADHQRLRNAVKELQINRQVIQSIKQPTNQRPEKHEPRVESKTTMKTNDCNIFSSLSFSA